MKYFRSSTFESHSLSDITFVKTLSIDKTSTGSSDMLYSSYIVPELKPKRSRILSSGIERIIGCCLKISTIGPSVETFGLIVIG